MIGYQLSMVKSIPFGIYPTHLLSIISLSLSNSHEHIQIQHNVGAQKIGGYTRYAVDQSAKMRLETELMLGYVQVMHSLLSFFTNS